MSKKPTGGIPDAIAAMNPADEAILSDLEAAEFQAVRGRITQHYINLGDLTEQFELQKVAIINAIQAEKQQRQNRVSQIVAERKLGWTQADLDQENWVLKRRG